MRINDQIGTAERRLTVIDVRVAELEAERTDAAEVAAAFADFERGGSPPSCGRKAKGTPKMLTYSASNKPESALTSYDVRRSPRPTTCSHKNWLEGAAAP